MPYYTIESNKKACPGLFTGVIPHYRNQEWKSPVIWLRISVYEDISSEKNEGFLMTQCKSTDKQVQGQMALDLGLGKKIEGKFDGGLISSDGGLLL